MGNIRDHFSTNWVNWIGVGIGVVGLGAAYYFYAQSKDVREPMFAVDSSRVQIVNAATVATAPIRVLGPDNKPILSNVYALRFYLWNAGRRAIFPSDVQDTVEIMLDDSTAKILDFRLLKVSRPVTHIVLDRGPDPRTLIVGFRILDARDGLAGQIIYQGSDKVPVVAKGSVTGAEVIRTARPPEREPLPLWAPVIMLVASLGMTFASAAASAESGIMAKLGAIFLAPINALSSRSFPPTMWVMRFNRLMSALAVVVALLLTIIALFWPQGMPWASHVPPSLIP